MINKILDYLFTFIRFLTPKSKLQLTLEEIGLLKSDPNNYGKVAMMYLKLSNAYAVLLGKGMEDNSWYYSQATFFYKQHEFYREEFFNYRNKKT